MRIGVSLRSSYAVEDVRLGARWMVERAAAARDAGLDSLFVGDHHVTGGRGGPHPGAPAATAEPYYQNSVILARLLAEWDERPAGALYLLPLWNPVLVAEQVGTLAALAQGRFILQCALGGGEAQFAGMGADIRRRVSAFESGLDTIRRLLAGEEVGSAAIAPVPPEPVEVWIGGDAPPAIDRAARLGDAWIAGPWATDEQVAAMLSQYRELCQAHGRTPAAVAIRRDIHVGADAKDAAEVAEPVLARGYRGFDLTATVVGGPAEVAERFAGYAAMGFTDVLVRHLADGQDDVLASFGRLGQVRSQVAALA
jgi:alkanesulfonate monooxygenase SsuD/methylene tetrahydromethanopterin reductase-like flavin-dependent oxidoreductase (luciferase family)